MRTLSFARHLAFNSRISPCSPRTDVFNAAPFLNKTKRKLFSNARVTFTEDSVTIRSKNWRRKYYAAAAVGTTLGLLAFGYGPQLKHAVEAGQRATRVVTALTLCIRDYRKVLRQLEDDPEDTQGLLSECHTRCAKRTFKVLEANGSIFIKLGQHLAAMGYLLPYEWTTVFIPLQDKCPVSSFESINKMILDDTGFTVAEIFSEFDPQPLGAASLAQVHRARLKDTGQEVAVKLQHPALAEWIPLDIMLTRFAFTNIKYFFPEYPLTWLSDEIESSLPQELNFECEATNILRTRDYFSKIPSMPLIVPNVIWAKPRILVMEHLPGKRLDDLEYMDSNGISRDEVSAALSHIFNEMIFGKDAPLHCDPHGGNLAIKLNTNRKRPNNFDIILYDHGLYRDIPQDLRRSYAKLWLAVIDADEARMRKYAYECAGITDQQFPLFASAITGRDYEVLTRSVTIPRSDDEKKQITNGMTQGLLAEIIQLLAGVPPIILLILKTNDLTRSLDENLKTNSGAERTFLILARYCSRTVFQEQMEQIKEHGGIWNLANIPVFFRALYTYWRVDLKLFIYEKSLLWGRRLGLATAH